MLMQETQHTMLKALWPLLAKGAILLYVTCSILPEENSLLIRQFVQENKQAILIPPSLDWAATSEWGWQILPGESAMDGFFYAKLQKHS